MENNLGLIFGLMVMGYVLLAMEILVVPGFGFFGIGSIVLLGVAAYFAFLKFGLLGGGISLLVSLIITIAGLIIFPKTRYGKRLMLQDSQSSEKGYVGIQDGLAELLGTTGKTISSLRPSGIVLIEGRRIDAVSSGDFLSNDTRIRVIQIEGNRVVVEPLPLLEDQTINPSNG